MKGFSGLTNYELQGGKKKKKLILHLKEKEGHLLRLGAHYDSESRTAILLNTRLRNVLGQGSKLDLNLKLGQHNIFSTDYGLSLGFANINFISSIWLAKSQIDLYSNNKLLSTLDYRNNGFSLGLEFLLGYYSSLSFQVVKEFSSIEENIYITQFEDVERDYLSFSSFFHFDNLDNYYFPREGFRLRLEATVYTDLLSDIEGINVYEGHYIQENFSAALQGVIPLFSFLSLELKSFMGHIYHQGDSAIPEKSFFIGGTEESFLSFQRNLIPFPGARHYEITGENVFLLQSSLSIEPISGYFLFSSFALAKVENNFESLFKDKNWHYGYLAGIGVETLFGPFKLSVSKRNNNDEIFTHFFIGFLF